MSKETVDSPQVIAFPPAMYIGTLMAGLIVHYIFPIDFVPRPIATISGIAAIFVAAIIIISAIRTMRRASTAVNPSLPTTAIVSDGVFGHSRNPIYLSFTLAYLGIALLFNALIAVLLLLPLLVIVQIGVIRREEVYLERKFGDKYLDYKTRVRRWV